MRTALPTKNAAREAIAVRTEVESPPLQVMHLLFGTDQVRELLAALQASMTSLQTYKRIVMWLGVMLAAMAVGFLNTSGMEGVWMPLGAMAIPAFAFVLAACLNLMEKTQSILRKLDQTLDLRAMSPLCEALEWRSSAVQRVVRTTLPPLLSQLRATNGHMLTRMARASLYRQLVISRAEHHARLLLAILRALEQVGDAQAVPYVERLAAAKTRGEAQERVRDAALACLPYLHERFGHHAGRHTLLRASAVQEGMPHTLLRSVTDVNKLNAEQLLRPNSTKTEAAETGLEVSAVQAKLDAR